MREKMSTVVTGVRTSAIQYEEGSSILTRDSCGYNNKCPSQCVRQGNREYSVSPIYEKRDK